MYSRLLFDIEYSVTVSSWPSIACADNNAAQSAGAGASAAPGATDVAAGVGTRMTSANVGAPVDVAADGNAGADEVIDVADILDDTTVADVPTRAAETMSHSGERGGVRTRARVRADSHVVAPAFVIVTCSLAYAHAVTTPW
jgi:hypothetical protein